MRIVNIHMTGRESFTVRKRIIQIRHNSKKNDDHDIDRSDLL